MAKIANMIDKLPALSEYEEQCRVIEWKIENIERLPDLEWLNASLNGARVSMGLAVKLKKAGMNAGIPDLNLPVPRGGYSGLYIEMKRENVGVVSDDQRRWLTALMKFGYYACVCHGHQAAIEVIENYLSGKIKNRKVVIILKILMRLVNKYCPTEKSIWRKKKAIVGIFYAYFRERG